MAVLRIVSERTRRVSYQAAVMYVTEDGKRRLVRRNAPTKSEAQKLEAQLILDRDKGIPRKGSPFMLATYLKQWLGKNHKIKIQTRERYAEHIASIEAEIGQVLLAKLTPLHLVQLEDALRARGLSGKTCLNVYRLLHRALHDAMRLELVSRNVAALVDPPGVVQKQHYVVTVAELRTLFSAASDTRIGPLTRVAAWTGLRLGELLALTWRDVDLDRGVISVEKSRDKKERTDTPKSRKGVRKVSLSPETIAVLAAIRDVADSDARPFPFTQYQVNRDWQRIKKRTGIMATFHEATRHAHASHMIAAGRPIPAVSARLGHSQVSTTLNIYAHALPHQDAELAALVDGVMM